MKLKSFMGALLCLPFTLAAQSSWSLEACIDHAIKHNIDLKQLALNVQNQKILLNTNQMSRLPNLNANVGQSFGFGRSMDREGITRDQSSSNSSFSATASLNLFSGMRTLRQITQRKLDIAASLQSLARAKEDLSLQITGFYLDALFLRELEKIAQSQLELAQEQLAITDKLVKAGKKPIAEKYVAEAEVASYEQKKVESNNQFDLARLTLMQVINAEVPLEEFTILEAPESWQNMQAILPNPELVYAYSIAHRPGIKSVEYDVKSAEQQIKIAKSFYSPSLSLNGGYSTNYFYNYNLEEGLKNPAFKWQLKNNASQNIGISLSIPIFNRMATRNGVKQAYVNLHNQELTLLKKKQDLFKEIQQAFYNAEASQKKHNAAQSAAKASEVAYQAERKRFDAGKGTSLELNNAQNRLEVTKSELAQAKFDWLFRYKILKFYQGESLF